MTTGPARPPGREPGDAASPPREAHRAHAHQDADAREGGSGAVRLTVVGAGTLLPHPERASAGHYLDGGGARLLLDCGPGVYRGMERMGIPWDRITHLALSHFHTDHVGDLPGLFFALAHALRPPRTAPLTVLGPRGLRRRFDHLVEAFGDHFEDPGFEVALVELSGGETWSPPEGGFSLACHRTPHTDVSLAYRWEGEGVAVGYTGDTGPSRQVAAFLAGCDLVVSECAFTDPAPDDNHLSPVSVAELARAAEPGLLLLTHVYPGQTPEEAARRVGEAGWPGRVQAARDGLTVRLGGDDAGVDPPGTPP